MGRMNWRTGGKKIGMKAAERREAIIKKLKNSAEPLSGAALAQELGVSRQVIVQDISILRAQGNEVLSTNRGYVLQHSEEASRVFKVIHTEEEIRKEFSIIVDCGGRIRDEFVYHKVYGTMRGELNIRSRLDIENYLKQIREGQSRPLMRATSGYHYHTVTAESREILDMIQNKLEECGFLAPLQDYEPVNFRRQSSL